MYEISCLVGTITQPHESLVLAHCLLEMERHDVKTLIDLFLPDSLVTCSKKHCANFSLDICDSTYIVCLCPSWLALNYNLRVSLIEPLRYHRRVIRNRDNNQITMSTVSDTTLPPYDSLVRHVLLWKLSLMKMSHN